jgi:hypothetical protein
MVNHDVVRLHVTMHDALAVAEIQSLQELVDVEPNVEIIELRIEAPKIRVVDVFEDQRGGLALHTLATRMPRLSG